ncbi:MAG: fumarylacetoacetate hydrolase family protein [Dehalococcoidia bacterium]
MKYYRIETIYGLPIIGVETKDGVIENITSVEEEIDDLGNLIKLSHISGIPLDDLTKKILADGNPEILSLERILKDSRTKNGDYQIDRPIDPPEVWAAGVTYKSSELERRRESDTPDIYSNIYQADRPEVFFKSTEDRCMGPFEDLGIRSDSTWDVPEPELAFVIFRGEIIGYTIGNDMSSRSIEGENPLYLPQAKLYDLSCSIGPCFVSTDTIKDPHNLEVTCTIVRANKKVFSGTTSTSEMARTCEEISDWLQRSNTVPDFTTVLTGTSIVPSPDFTLAEGDVVKIEISSIGILENTVVKV